MRLPTFSRQSTTDNSDDERPTVATGGSTNGEQGRVSAPNDATTTRFTTAGAAADRASAGRAAAQADRAAANADRAATDRAAADRAAADRTATNSTVADRDTDRTGLGDRPGADERAGREPVAAGPKPRASLLATLGLILAVASALLVLSGPLLGYGIGVGAVALILSLAGLRATRRRHVAGKTDALIGTVLALAAIAVGALALTGSLSWLGTDMQPVNTVREWLDAQFIDRF